MRLLAALAAGSALFMLATRVQVASLTDRVSAYLVIARRPPPVVTEQVAAPLASAGINWSAAEVSTRRIGAAVAGVIVGLLASQGDLFFAGSGRSAPALGAVGGLTGLLGFRVWVTQRTERRERRLVAELPVIADLIALRVLAGEGVSSALEHVVEGTSGVAAAEFGSVLRRYRDGHGLAESLQTAVRDTVASDAGRLYVFLANAHQSGGRLAESLLALSSDYRSQQERALQVEGGKRALAIYAPILALMIPVALMFLMYPTLAGLSELSAIP